MKTFAFREIAPERWEVVNGDSGVSFVQHGDRARVDCSRRSVPEGRA